MGLLLGIPTQKVEATSDQHTLARSFKKQMPIGFWDDLAQCETRSNWKDKGQWGGGLGMAVQTWRNYGGRQFSSHPSGATKEQQIEVARRVAVNGFQTKNQFLTLADRQANRPFFRPAAGWFGWGCIANNTYLRPWVWLRNNR